jgi:hypothetical protein
MCLGKRINKKDISNKLSTLINVMDNSCDYQVHNIIVNDYSVWSNYFVKVRVDVYGSFRNIFQL